MPITTIEVISRRSLPESFKTGPLTVEVFHKLSPVEIATWAADQYWFQTFPWTPRRKDGQRTADSAMLWNTIVDQCLWRDRNVLDIGTHYGYHAIQASRAGATVIGMDVDKMALDNARVIDRYIEQEGIEYVAADPGGRFDIILYLSVHHQIDESYKKLAETILGYRRRCEDLFVELILPSSCKQFGRGMSDDDVDRLVGGLVLTTYKHPIRGFRRVYHVKGESK